MYKYISTFLKVKPIYKDDLCIQYTLHRDQLLQLQYLNPPYQTDLNPDKVTQMIHSYHHHPEFGRFKNIIVFAVRMSGTKLLYLVDGQHRMEVLKQEPIEYPFTVLFYPIHSDDEMRQLFREMNYDSHKNLEYISLGTDTARLADELLDHYSSKLFTKSKKESRLYTIRSFIDLLSDYLPNFKTLDEVVKDLESKQLSFIQELDFTHSYAEERTCIESNFIMPLKECNFVDYLTNPFIEPCYRGKGKTISKTIPLSLKKMVWNQHVGRSIGEILCPVCDATMIQQISFHCGHVVAKHKGGLNTVENLKPICGSCNSSMGTMNMDEFIDKLRNGY